MIENAFWWPLDLSPAADRACEDLRAALARNPVALDVEAVERVSAALAALMARHVGDVVERDGLPHLCHVVNGWGDALWGGVPLSDGYGAFVHRDPAGEPFVLQCDPEGDFHPWQSFAYALMAGVDPDRQLAPGGVSLRSLARHSRFLNTTEGTELGHLLFALGTLGPDLVDPPFSMRGEACDRSRLMEKAVEAHDHGGFEVCRKFHLTEGLCAMAAGFPDLAGYREAAQGYLEGQLDVLWPLAVILREAGRSIAAGEPPAPESLLAELREALVLGNYLENHCYYAGHLIELAGLAESLGYRIRAEHRSVIHWVLNELNAILPAYLPHVSFLDCFLHLGHYRRAATLCLELERTHGERRELTPRDLAAYRCDFDELAGRAWLAPAPLVAAGDDAGPAGEPPGLAAGVYALASSTAAPRYPVLPYVTAEYPRRIAAMIEQLGLASAIAYFRGGISDDDLAACYGAMDLLVHPTCSLDENFGYAPVEAMACGTPVVGAAYGGLKDTVVSGQTGFLMPTWTTPSGIRMDLLQGADQVEQVLGDAALRRRLSAAAARRAATVYGHAACAEVLYAAVRSAVAARRAGEGVPVRLAPSPPAATPGDLLPALVRPWEHFERLAACYASGGPPPVGPASRLRLAAPLLPERGRWRLDDPAWPALFDLTTAESAVADACATAMPFAQLSRQLPVDRELAQSLVDRGLLLCSNHGAAAAAG